MIKNPVNATPRGASAATDLDGLGDADLLDRFTAHGGEAGGRAFEALVRRHGPMVLRTCRGTLRDEHAALDAFQATFLVLWKRSAGLRVRDTLAPWLHEVAYRVSCAARSAEARRARHERTVAEMSPARVDGPAPDDGPALLHEELSRLPDRFRRPVVLCYLEGLTSDEAARRLGWPVGTVRSRLARGREKLRSRLVRRGVQLSSALFGASALTGAPPEALPDGLVEATSRAVALAAAGGALPAAVSGLVDQGLRAGGRAASRAALVAAAVVGPLAVVVAVVALRPAAPAPVGAAPAPAPAPAAPAAAPDRRPATWVELPGRPRSGAWDLAVSADGRTLVVAQFDALVAWDLADLRERYRVAVTGKAVRRVALTPDGRTLVTAEYPPGGKPAEGDVVTVRDGRDGHALRVLRGHKTGVNCAAVAPDGKLVASNDWGDKDVRLWDAATGEPLPPLAGHERPVITVVFSHDGKTLASCGHDGTVRLWDVATRKARAVLRGHGDGVESVAFSADDAALASCGYDATVRLWDAATGAPRASASLPDSGLAVAFRPDGRGLAVTSASWGRGRYDSKPCDLVVWDFAASRAPITVRAGAAQIFGLSFTPDGRRLTTAGLDGSVRVWDVATLDDPRR